MPLITRLYVFSVLCLASLAAPLSQSQAIPTQDPDHSFDRDITIFDTLIAPTQTSTEPTPFKLPQDSVSAAETSASQPTTVAPPPEEKNTNTETKKAVQPTPFELPQGSLSAVEASASQPASVAPPPDDKFTSTEVISASGTDSQSSTQVERFRTECHGNQRHSTTSIVSQSKDNFTHTKSKQFTSANTDSASSTAVTADPFRTEHRSLNCDQPPNPESLSSTTALFPVISIPTESLLSSTTDLFPVNSLPTKSVLGFQLSSTTDLFPGISLPAESSLGIQHRAPQTHLPLSLSPPRAL
ncbi:hypothetical protein C8F04DRAFT_1196196 [Mycena alexandri]|uniref:Uncharacterized protein n=1 Tax=Mycena alexandri TaxID=1745969 RepID=A0AAD6S4A5_9AGAR|nr:hypothetical protein C8F04DRAFT_1196196 [Mycena alexandri]